jgi:4-hydroxythreonine-4-phosphate dehydrogenase
MQPLLLTMGDPTGIGPELIIKALLEGSYQNLYHPLTIVGDRGVLEQAAKIFTDDLQIEQTGDQRFRLTIDSHQLDILNVSQLDATTLQYGQPDNSCGQAMAQYVDHAISACLAGTAAGIVTCPINKAAINASGYHFPGHTELLAERCGTEKVVMMLAGEQLKVCLVTTHLAYRDVPERLTSAEIEATIRITASALTTQFGIPEPKLAVLALNPHAGEDGLFGDEEQRLIQPAINQVRAEGINADGPHSADTLFYFAVKGEYDAVVCMYHDQGLIPLKLLHFDDGVNVTLGLPIVRTSVDHGTAYNLAGTGQANTASLIAALKMADQMAQNIV